MTLETSERESSCGQRRCDDGTQPREFIRLVGGPTRFFCFCAVHRLSSINHKTIINFFACSTTCPDTVNGEKTEQRGEKWRGIKNHRNSSRARPLECEECEECAASCRSAERMNFFPRHFFPPDSAWKNYYENFHLFFFRPLPCSCFSTRSWRAMFLFTERVQDTLKGGERESRAINNIVKKKVYMRFNKIIFQLKKVLRRDKMEK